MTVEKEAESNYGPGIPGEFSLKNIPKRHLINLTANKFNLHGMKVFDALCPVPEYFPGLIRFGIMTLEICQSSDFLMEANA